MSFVGRDRGLPSTPKGRKFYHSRRVTPGDDLHCNEGLVPLENFRILKKKMEDLSITLNDGKITYERKCVNFVVFFTFY